jgi:hypothetical protein
LGEKIKVDSIVTLNTSCVIFISTTALAMHFLGFLGFPKQHYELHYPNIQILRLPKKSQTGTEKSNPPYLPNGGSVKEFFYIIGFITLENGGGRSSPNI